MPNEINAKLERILQELADTRRGFTGEIADTRQGLVGLGGEIAENRQGFAGLAREIADTRQNLAHEIVNSRHALEARIDDVEEKLDSFREETVANFDEVYRRLERLESEYHAISAALLRVEENLSEGRAEREELQKEVDSLKARLSVLEKKLAELENELRDDHDA